CSPPPAGRSLSRATSSSSGGRRIRESVPICVAAIPGTRGRRILSAPRPRAGRTPANESPITITSPGVRKIYRFRAPRVKAVTLPRRGVIAMTYSAPAPHRSALPTRAQDRRKVVPHLTNRIGALVATAGLALSLISFYLPWLHSYSGSFTALDIT